MSSQELSNDQKHSQDISFDFQVLPKQKQFLKSVVSKLNKITGSHISHKNNKIEIHAPSLDELQIIVSLFDDVEQMLKSNNTLTTRELPKFLKKHLPANDLIIDAEQDNSPKTTQDKPAASPYRPASILLHGYKQLQKRYGDAIEVSVFSQHPDIKSHSPQHKSAAMAAMKDLQVSYTLGTLDEDKIQEIINESHPDQTEIKGGILVEGLIKNPENLHKIPGALGNEVRKTFQARNELNTNKSRFLFKESLDIPEMSPSLQKSISSVFKSLRKRLYVSVSYKNNASKLSISGNSQDNVVLLENAFTTFFEHLKKETIDLSTEDENYVPLQEQLSRHIYSVLPERSEPMHDEDFYLFRDDNDRVVSHRVLEFTEIDGVNLNLLAQHLLSHPAGLENPMSPLRRFHGIAKGAVNDDGLACVRLQMPIFSGSNPKGDKRLLDLLKDAIKLTATEFNEGSSPHLSQQAVIDVLQKLTDERREALSAVRVKSKDELSPENKAQLEELEALSVHNLKTSLNTLLAQPEHEKNGVTMSAIAKSLNYNIDEPLIYSALNVKLGHVSDAGFVAFSNGRYKKPQAFSGEVAFDVFKGQDDTLYMQPQDWDDSRYGGFVKLPITRRDIAQHNLKDGDFVIAHVDYKEGNASNVELKYVENRAEENQENQISVSQKDVKHNNDKGAILPEDGILTGVVERHNGTLYFSPSLQGVKDFKLDDETLHEGHILQVKVDAQTQRISDILDDHGSVHQKDGLSKLTLLESGYSLRFPDGILDDISLTIPKVEDGVRKDFRHVPFITIDPETAKDFDDAIYVENLDNDRKRIYVAIADVSHYIPTNSKLFAEMVKRGTSIYLPELTIPMLPPELSNELCSLKPHEDRAALVTAIDISADGQIESFSIERGLINSHARFEYNEIQDAIEGNTSERVEPYYESHVKPALEAYEALAKDRVERGALKLDRVVQRISTTDDGTRVLEHSEQNESHSIIEEFMIVTNRCAIQALIDKDSPLLARVHGTPNPDTLKKFIGKLTDLGVVIPAQQLSPEELVENILEQAQKLPETKDEITELMIRSQDRAHYSANLDEHYALKLLAYTHFTSPIRRLTDFLVHCLLNDAVGMKGAHRLDSDQKKQLGEFALQASTTEREADDLQKMAESRLAAKWVEDHMSDVFNATVTSIGERGAHIKIIAKDNDREQNVRAIIPLKEFAQKVSSDANSDAAIKPGSEISVRVTEVNPIKNIIDFVPVAV